uniref:Shisa N-terminal domain-containing protein n=1 Tax=Oreochromis niloticus TaxID=8128 RepID=A0A669BRM0_ORENI
MTALVPKNSFGSTLTLSSLYPRSCLTDESCLSFVDTYGVTHDAEKCNKYCCGTCNLRYCCKDKPKQLNQESCSGSLARCGLVFNLFFVMEFNSSAVCGSHNLLFGSLLPLLHEMSKKAD